MSNYQQAYAQSMHDPNGFWGAAAQLVKWDKKPKIILDDSNVPLYRWFSDGMLNTCYNALDRHVIDGRADQPAVIHESAITGKSSILTYAQMLEKVARFAGALRMTGVEKGDRVVIYMPMVPEALVAMLACARLGAVHSVVFGGFAPAELAARIDDAKPKVIVSASCGLEPTRIIEYKPMLDESIALATHKPGRCIILQREQHLVELGPLDMDWKDAMAMAEPAECVSVAATDPLYILYTSGTTGKPKGIVRDNGGHAVALTWSMKNVYNIEAGDMWWSASDVGWVVGHSYIVYAPLFAGATTIVFEGKPVGTPDAGTFWRVIEKYGVKGLFTAPTAIRAIRKEDYTGEFIKKTDLSKFENLFLAGERLDPDTYHWATENLGVPVIDNWWQTETGWPIASNLRGLEPMPIKPGSPTVPIPGYEIKVLDELGNELPPGTEGNIAITLPLPPGTLPTLWGDDQRYIDSYLTVFPGMYASGDGGYVDEDGYVYIMGRTDDVINVAGHRLSTGSLEAVVATHNMVAECAVIGVADAIKGQIPKAFVVLKAGAQVDAEELRKEIVALVRKEVGPVAALNEVVVVPGLPKTRSGKVLRKTMRGIADGKQVDIPSTIEDASILDILRPLLRPES
ncbi:MAG: acetate--CoA ligase [Actinobacteria bacterium]|nr:acetate--CoA ligase [Actinomycetota bacterium]MSW25580.1 acetate--CoA ligase [Actinomycetota bacterium]MSX29902.1 acetate--CoA ligase [Actinomycetota bacterium]MSX42860.1 acetate--CoA ligase [Actinomycetota bacterium]MSX96525.1 acetate--CoA ligase [Actinomycetota bacterium]